VLHVDAVNCNEADSFLSLRPVAHECSHLVAAVFLTASDHVCYEWHATAAPERLAPGEAPASRYSCPGAFRMWGDPHGER
jgi:hypothetical protein